MPSPFTESDLFSHISRDEWEPLSRELVAQGDEAPFISLNAEAWAEFEHYTRRYEIENDIARKHWRVLVIYFGYVRLAKPPGKWEKIFDRTYTYMKEVRDGKFPDLAEEDPLPEGVSDHGGEFGSEEGFSSKF